MEGTKGKRFLCSSGGKFYPRHFTLDRLDPQGTYSPPSFRPLAWCFNNLRRDTRTDDPPIGHVRWVQSRSHHYPPLAGSSSSSPTDSRPSLPAPGVTTSSAATRPPPRPRPLVLLPPHPNASAPPPSPLPTFTRRHPLRLRAYAPPPLPPTSSTTSFTLPGGFRSPRRAAPANSIFQWLFNMPGDGHCAYHAIAAQLRMLDMAVCGEIDEWSVDTRL